MSEKETSPYLTDEIYLPFHYTEIHIKSRPYFKGKGNMSVNQLEELCLQFEEYNHQQAIIKQNCMSIIVKLKANQKV